MQIWLFNIRPYCIYKMVVPLFFFVATGVYIFFLDQFRKYFPNLMSKIFSSISVMVLALTFRSQLHFKLICVCGITVKIYLFSKHLYSSFITTFWKHWPLTYFEMIWHLCWKSVDHKSVIYFWTLHSFHWFMGLYFNISLSWLL